MESEDVDVKTQNVWGVNLGHYLVGHVNIYTGVWVNQFPLHVFSSPRISLQILGPQTLFVALVCCVLHLLYRLPVAAEELCAERALKRWGEETKNNRYNAKGERMVN